MKEALAAGIAGGFVLGSIFGASVYHVARRQADKVIGAAHQVVDSALSHARAAQSLVGDILMKGVKDAQAVKADVAAKL